MYWVDWTRDTLAEHVGEVRALFTATLQNWPRRKRLRAGLRQ